MLHADLLRLGYCMGFEPTYEGADVAAVAGQSGLGTASYLPVQIERRFRRSQQRRAP
jgi:hypothetical protein